MFVARCLLALTCLLAAAEAVRAQADAEFAKGVEPFLAEHCLNCHGERKQRSGVRFDLVRGFQEQESPLWTKVHEAVSSGRMPPPEEAQPKQADTRRMLTWIENQQRKTVGGMRRLNRREFSAALKDLTGLAVDYAQGLPGDGKVAGFDTGAAGLQDAADSVAVAMTVTRRAVDGIRFLDAPSGTTYATDLRAAADPKKLLDNWKSLNARASGKGVYVKGQGLLMEPQWVGDRDGTDFVMPAPPRNQGVLRLKVAVSVMKPFPGMPNPRLWVEVSGKDIDYHEITADFEKPQVLTYDVQLDDLAVEPKGVVVRLVNRIETPYSVEGFENEDTAKPEEQIPGGTGWYRPRHDRKLPPDKRPTPFIVLQSVEIEMGHVAAWPPKSWGLEVGTLKDDESTATRLLTLWIERAWRRPVQAQEIEPFMALYRQVRKDGTSFDDALRAAFQSVLMSGGFRYLTSPVQQDASLSQHAIASRLSFMLWGAPPDEELRKLAAAGRLRDPKVLDAQVDRLLSDARSAAFIEPFVLQWLEMEQPITIASTHIKKQDFRFARHLKASMRDETTAYFARLLADNRPAREIVDSDWTMMNDILAIHYGYKDIDGSHLRKVTLRPDDPRGGGILGHAGIQSMLTWMGGNWVIYRGAWTLRHILDDPPPPPPLEVPELNASEGANKGKPFRLLLQQHQEDANCSVCHRKMDPMGFAFQNFDLSGRWRDVEHESYHMADLDGKIEWRGVGATRPVDAVGSLPRGETFQSFAECKRLIVRHYTPDLLRGLLKNLTLYGTGRLPDVHDLAEIRSIIRDHEARGHPMRDLLKALVRSRAFLER